MDKNKVAVGVRDKRWQIMRPFAGLLVGALTIGPHVGGPNAGST